MKLTNILAINLLASLLVFNSFSMKKDNTNTFTKYIDTTNALINSSDFLSDYLLGLETNEKEFALLLLDSLKIEALPELINKDLVKISNYADVAKIKRVIIKMVRDIESTNSNNELDDKEKIQINELNIKIATNKILDECIKLDAVCSLLKCKKEKINEYINLEKSIKSILNYFTSNKKNFDNIFQGIEYEKIEKKFALPKNSLKLCFSKAQNPKEQEEIDNIRTNLLAMVSESAFNEAKFYQVKGFTFTTLAMLALWYAGHAISHDLMESLEPQSFIINTLLTLTISYSIFRIAGNINTSSLHPNTFFLIFIGFPIINDFLFSSDEETKKSKEDKSDDEEPRIVEIKENSKEENLDKKNK